MRSPHLSSFSIVYFFKSPCTLGGRKVVCSGRWFFCAAFLIFFFAFFLFPLEGDYVITSSLPPSSSTWPVSIKTHNVRMHLCCGFELYQTKKRRCGLSTLPNMTRLTLVCLSICLLVSVYDVQSAAVLVSLVLNIFFFFFCW